MKLSELFKFFCKYTRKTFHIKNNYFSLY